MILDLKNIKRIDVLEGTRLRVVVNYEDFYAMLDRHSPNLLIEYLNRRYNISMDLFARKETDHDTI